MITDLLWKLWYPTLTRLTRNASVSFLNYGYADAASPPATPPLQAADESDRPCIQLYHHVVSPISFAGLNVLEISCGHGGGASYLARYLEPKSLHAVDRNARAIQLCQERHRVTNLTFSVANALALDFPANTFDAVINVEASHCYPDLPQFLKEVHRVLRPGGHFLYADFRDRGPPRDLLHRQLAQSGLEILRCEDISPQVLRGMQMNAERYSTLIRQTIPRPLRKPAQRFAGVPGSRIYRELESGATIYLAYHLQKPAAELVQAF